jgi:hypothetical protein
MSRRKPFTQADISRALKGAQSAGLKIQRFEIEPATGKIVIVSGETAPSEPPNPFDAWKARDNARSA